MTGGELRAAPHHLYFTMGEPVGTPEARFPDCGLRWLYTPPPVYLPAWPTVRANSTAPYTTVAHWWGSRFEFEGQVINEEKHVSFLEYQALPSQTPARLELAICLGEHYDEWRAPPGSSWWEGPRASGGGGDPPRKPGNIQQSRRGIHRADPRCVHACH